MAGRGVSGGLARGTALLGLLLLAGCAHRAPAPALLEPRALEARYAALLEARRVRLAGTFADASVWLETSGARFPGTRGTVALGGADTLRLRLASSFGTALDLGAAGDSLVLWIPSRRTVVRANAAAAPVRLPDAAGFGVRAIAATWPVPAEAWREARAADTLTVLRWRQAADTLELSVGGSGLPRALRLARPGMRGMRVTYLDYGWHDGTPWPERFDVEDEAGAVRLRVRVRHLERRAAGEAWTWAPDVPADADAVAAEDLWQWIETEWAP